MANSDELIPLIRNTNDEKVLYLLFARIINNLTFKKRNTALAFWIDKLENCLHFSCKQDTDTLLYLFNNVEMENYTIQDFFTFLKNIDIERDKAGFYYIKSAIASNKYY